MKRKQKYWRRSNTNKYTTRSKWMIGGGWRALVRIWRVSSVFGSACATYSFSGAHFASAFSTSYISSFSPWTTPLVRWSNEPSLPRPPAPACDVYLEQIRVALCRWVLQQHQHPGNGQILRPIFQKRAAGTPVARNRHAGYRTSVRCVVEEERRE